MKPTPFSSSVSRLLCSRVVDGDTSVEWAGVGGDTSGT